MVDLVSPHVAAREMSDPPARVVMLVGEHDLSTVSDVERALASAVASGDPVVVDLRQATFADSAILGAIIRAHERSGRRCFAVVMPPSGEVSRLFDLVDARAVLTTLPTVRLALDWCYPTVTPGSRAGRGAHRV